MPEHQRPYTSATVGVQRAGDGRVIVTLYATEEQVADLAWQLNRIVHSPTYPSATFQGQCREFYKDTIDGLAKGAPSFAGPLRTRSTPAPPRRG